MAFSCCGLVCEIGISLTTYYRRRTLDCGSQTLRRSRTGHVFGEQVVEALHLGVRDQRDGAARTCAQLRKGFRRACAGISWRCFYSAGCGGGAGRGRHAEWELHGHQTPASALTAAHRFGTVNGSVATASTPMALNFAAAQSLRNIGRLTGEHAGGQGGYSEL